MTTVSGVMVRDFSPETFATLADITGCPTQPTWSRVNGITTLTFDADLEADQEAAVLAVMTSRDDADQERRAALVEALAVLEPVELAEGAEPEDLTAVLSDIYARLDNLTAAMSALAAHVLNR